MSVNGNPYLEDSHFHSQSASGGYTFSCGDTSGHLHVENLHTDDERALSGSIPSCEVMNGHPINGIKSNHQAPIAICGMAVRLPSGLSTPQQLWNFLLAKGDARSRVPKSRYNLSAFHNSTGKPGTVITEYGYFLDEDIGNLDTSFFSMPRMEVERTDPQQRLMLEATRECLEDAGETNWRGKRIGCYMGVLGDDWCEMFARETQNWGPYRLTGYGVYVLSNRISYEMDLQGPSMTVQTACSSSLVALHEACMAISSGACESAIIGGANLIMTPGATMGMTEQNILSKDGSCKTFSAEADGYARGEAITAIYIKKLDDALRDGNPIRAVIRGTAANHDGKTPGMAAPSIDAQERLMKRAYEVAGITDFSRTGFVECHGTGTAVGDPIETKAVSRVFGKSGVYIGSIKPNLGHTEGASGLLSVIKTVLALENRTIPPNIKFSRPNPAIPFESGKLTVPTEPTPWPRDRWERASVNSFGVAGANAHVVIDSAASFNASIVSKRASNEPQLLLFSANSQKSLARMVDNYRDFIEVKPESIGDLAYTLANKREHLSHRTFVIARKGTVGPTAPATKVTQAPAVIMVFSGQGAQWPQMGRDLLDSNVTFLNSIRCLDGYLQRLHKHKPDWRIEEELRKPGTKSRVNAARFSQPLCAAVQIALVDTLVSLGIQPDGVVGHSSGEIAAAYAAGALTAEEAIITAMHRGDVVGFTKRSGAMAAVGLPWKEAEKYLTSNVAIACDNSPKSVTISGDVDEVEAVIADIHKSQPDVLARKLRVDKAYHSYHMVEIGEEYHSLIKNRVSDKEPVRPFFSSVTGNLLDKSVTLGSRYWRSNIESPVLFRAAVSSILLHPIGKNPVFLEIGPHSALAGPLRQILSQESNSAPYISTLIRNQNCAESLLSAVGKIYALQVPVNLKALIPIGSCLSDLPPYPWDHKESYWYESRLSKEYRQRKYAHHDLLGSRIIESTDFEPSWRNLFHLDNVPWVSDHKVGDDITFPFAGYTAMAGEAVRQMTGIDKAFRLRHVIISTALVVAEGRPTELITTLRRLRLTDSLQSQWWEFTIASHNGHTWTKHCGGETMAQSENLESSQMPKTLPRKVEARKWFDNLREAGLDLGPAFRNLGGISASTTTQQATGKVSNDRHLEGNKYHLHPTVIDSAIQLLAIAFANGVARKHVNRLPTICDDLSISRSSSDYIVGSETKFMGGSVIGECQGVADGITVLKISGLRFSAIDNSDIAGKNDTHAAARQEWGPDVDFISLENLIRPSTNRSLYMASLEELSQLSLLYSQRCQAGPPTVDRPHLQRFRHWIDDQVGSMDVPSLKGLKDSTIYERLELLVHRLAGTPAASVAAALQRVCSNIGAIFSGQVSSLEDILPSETISEVYEFIDDCDYSLFIQKLAHCKPNLRILEIGSWRTCVSTSMSENLTLPNGRILCSKYTHTSKGYVSTQDHEIKLPYMEYTTLDVDKDPLEQGFEGHQYDLVIARNVLHTSKSIGASLLNIRKLLHPTGHLLLQELCPTTKWINFIFGTNPRWWCGLADSRQNEPYVCMERWQNELVAAGYEGTDATLLDAEEPFQLNGFMIVRPSTVHSRARQVSLLCHEKTRYQDSIIQELEARGYEIARCSIYDCIPPGRDVISLLDIDGPFLENIDSTTFDSFKNFIQSLDNSGVFWITQLSQVHCQDPRYAQIIGTARTLRSELLVDFATCEVDDIALSAFQIVQTFSKFQMRDESDSLKPDLEYVIYGGVINVGRLYPFTLSDELLTSEPSDRSILKIGIPGRPSTLHWIQQPVASALQPDEVEIEMYSVGLNFRDVLVAMNIVQLPQTIFGLEGAGVVRRVGSQVKNLGIGDRVAMVERGTFSTLVVTLEILCAKLPDEISFEEASTMLFPFITATHSLMTVGGLKKGQSVLIHSACGGVGLAAIQVAQMVQAAVYVTVGTEEKVQHVMKTFNISRDRIFNSRDDSFVKGVMHETRGEGVDLVLSSLSGELLHSTWKCVAPFGKMVEIGKRDLIGFAKLDMNVFLANRSYCCVDVDSFRDRPILLSQMLNLVLDLWHKGLISPIRPKKVFNAASPYDAFRYMQPGQHIGRICLSIRESPGSINLDTTTINRVKTLELNDSSSYLLVGGLGGLGRAISIWMVERGARHLIFLSRSAGQSSDDELFVNELNSMGCEVQLVRGSVTRHEDVVKVIKSATRPLKGILQMSMVLRDENFLKMTLEQWDAANLPKIKGTWNLHNVSTSEGLDLDFFVLFSSLSGIIGQPGQANYASANTFLDAFVQFRTTLGLPASAIDIGAVGDVGYISQNQGLAQKMTTTGFKVLNLQEVLDALVLAMTSKTMCKTECGSQGSQFVDRNNFILGLGSKIPFNSPANRAVWRKDRRMAIYHSTAGGIIDTVVSSGSLKSYIASAKANTSILKTADATNFFAREIGKNLLRLLLKPEEDLNTSLSLADLGMDSLVGIELRTWWKQIFGFNIGLLEMLGMGTLEALGQHAAEGLMKATILAEQGDTTQLVNGT
ncbi:MAG: hypothetical protein MMC33_007754 [Icmadophila ericetorum]|nr:hypothetical protein [Icmadophila ericetorum]